VRRNSHGQPGKSSSGVYNKDQTGRSSQFASETAAPAACGPGASERGGEGAGGGGGACWGRAPGAARVLFIGFFFSTRSARGARTKITSILGKNHARGKIIDCNQQSQAPACDFAYLGLQGLNYLKSLRKQQALSLLTEPESALPDASRLDDPEALASLTIGQYDNTVHSNKNHRRVRPWGVLKSGDRSCSDASSPSTRTSSTAENLGSSSPSLVGEARARPQAGGWCSHLEATPIASWRKPRGEKCVLRGPQPGFSLGCHTQLLRLHQCLRSRWSPGPGRQKKP
jgi:hypothetical protein